MRAIVTTMRKSESAHGLNEGMRMVAAFLDGLKDSHTRFLTPQRPYRLDYGYRYQLFGNEAFITRVRPGTDAESKVHPGDRVEAINTYSVNLTDFEELSYYLDALSLNPQLNLISPIRPGLPAESWLIPRCNRERK